LGDKVKELRTTPEHLLQFHAAKDIHHLLHNCLDKGNDEAFVSTQKSSKNTAITIEI
jgi:hypothetical protein